MSILDASCGGAVTRCGTEACVGRTFHEVRLKGLRAIRNLPVAFDCAVSMLARPNACGKSTVLFACATA